MTMQQTIPLNQLIQSKANVRSTGRHDSVADLAASIAAHGLRQNLNVLPTADGRYAVVAGGRRLRALKLLAKEKRLAKDAPVACLVLAASDDAAEISLVENTLRLAMHPDDQCEAFRALIEGKGMGLEDVAARFGVTPAVVQRRLKLAHVAPALRALYRKGEMTLDHMMALAISDDHAAQQQAWDNLPDWNRDAGLLRDALTGEAVPLTDKRARFVGVDAYVAAGGAVLRDLFDEEHEGYLPDRALVQRLADAKLAVAVEAVRAEGWQWAVGEITRDYAVTYGRVYPHSFAEDEDAPDLYAPEDMARAGARLTLGHDGTLRIERGLVRSGDDEAEEGAAEGTSRRGGGSTGSAADLPATMVRELTAHRTAALRIELARNPTVALAATVHALALSLLYPGSGLVPCLALRASSADLSRITEAPGDSPAHAAMEADGARWGDRLPGDPADLWGWCLAQPQDVLLDLLAYLTALSVNAVQEKEDRPGHARLADADRLAGSLNLDMRQWWTPSVDGFYRRLSKTALAEAMREAGKSGSTVVIATLKKDVAARHTAQVLDGSGWLPAPLRPAESTGAADGHAEAA
jgi:ParB family chromosome partitioning protein